MMTVLTNVLVAAFFGAFFFGLFAGIWWVVRRIHAWTRPPK